MNRFFNKWIEAGHNKVNEIGATLTSGAMVANGMAESWTLSDWSTLIGIIYVLSMLIPRLIAGYQWLKTKWENRKND